MIDDGVKCSIAIHARGVCPYHYLYLLRRDLLDKYCGTSRFAKRKFEVKKRVVNGICRVKENDKGCKRNSKSRGLCNYHYMKFFRAGSLKKFGVLTYRGYK